MGGFKAKSNDSLEDFITETLQENIIDCALMDNNGNIITGKFDPNYIYRRLPDYSTYVKLSVPKNKKSLGDNLYLPSFPYTNRKIYIKQMDQDLNHKYLDFDGIPYIYSQ